MREAEFRAWLERSNYAGNTVRTQLSQARRLADAYGSLEALFKKDGFSSLRESLGYSKEDARKSRPMRLALCQGYEHPAFARYASCLKQGGVMLGRSSNVISALVACACSASTLDFAAAAKSEGQSRCQSALNIDPLIGV